MYRRGTAGPRRAVWIKTDGLLPTGRTALLLDRCPLDPRAFEKRELRHFGNTALVPLPQQHQRIQRKGADTFVMLVHPGARAAAVRAIEAHESHIVGDAQAAVPQPLLHLEMQTENHL